MLHIAVLSGTAGPADIQLTPVLDSVIPRLTDVFQMPRPWSLVGAASVFSALATDSGLVLDIPTYADLGQPQVLPNIAQASGDRLMLDLSLYPIALQTGDPVGARALAQAASTPTAVAALVFADRLTPPGPGPVFWARYSASGFAGTAGAWNPGTLTFITRLAAGRYRALAMRHVQTNGDVARLTLADAAMRPGALCMKGTGYAAGEGQTMPAPAITGVMCEFDAVAPPGIEVFGTTAVASTGTGALLLQRVDALGGA